MRRLIDAVQRTASALDEIERRWALPAIGHLIALKVLSETDRRLKDRQDLFALIAAADDTELARAHAAVELITQRGFDRGRDLPTALRRWIDRVRVA